MRISFNCWEFCKSTREHFMALVNIAVRLAKAVLVWLCAWPYLVWVSTLGSFRLAAEVFTTGSLRAEGWNYDKIVQRDKAPDQPG